MTQDTLGHTTRLPAMHATPFHCNSSHHCPLSPHAAQNSFLQSETLLTSTSLAPSLMRAIPCAGHVARRAYSLPSVRPGLLEHGVAAGDARSNHRRLRRNPKPRQRSGRTPRLKVPHYGVFSRGQCASVECVSVKCMLQAAMRRWIDSTQQFRLLQPCALQEMPHVK